VRFALDHCFADGDRQLYSLKGRVPANFKFLVYVMDELRRYGTEKGERIYFSGDPATDDTAKEIDFLYVPSRFFHTSFAQKYQMNYYR
jgi:hypothetical protein